MHMQLVGLLATPKCKVVSSDVAHANSGLVMELNGAVVVVVAVVHKGQQCRADITPPKKWEASDEQLELVSGQSAWAWRRGKCPPVDVHHLYAFQ